MAIPSAPPTPPTSGGCGTAVRRLCPGLVPGGVIGLTINEGG